MLFLCGCKGKSNTMPVLNGITFDADITYYNEAYKGSCSLLNGVFKFTVSEPELLSGYTLTFDGDSVTAEYLGITYTPNKSNMPFSSVAGEIYQKLTEIINSSDAAVKSGDSYVIEGGQGRDAYKLYISSVGIPLSLEIPDERFTVYFYNSTIKEIEKAG